MTQERIKKKSREYIGTEVAKEEKKHIQNDIEPEIQAQVDQGSDTHGKKKRVDNITQKIQKSLYDWVRLTDAVQEYRQPHGQKQQQQQRTEGTEATEAAAAAVAAATAKQRQTLNRRRCITVASA